MSAFKSSSRMRLYLAMVLIAIAGILILLPKSEEDLEEKAKGRRSGIILNEVVRA